MATLHTAALDEWTLWQQAQGHSENTIEARRRRVEVFAATAQCDPITATSSDVIRYLAGLRRSRSTRATYYSHLRAWFTWLVRMEYRPDDPCIRVPPPRSPRRQPRPLTDQQLEAVLAVRMHRRTRMMVLLAAFQGLRVHEIAKIRGEHVDLLGGSLRVLGKGGVDCVLPLHPFIAELAATFPRRGYWFTTHVGNRAGKDGPILSRSVSDIIGDAMTRAGVAGGAHRLRHTYATRLLSNGANVRIVQELLRHASLQTTQVYTGITFEQMRVALVGMGYPDPVAA